MIKPGMKVKVGCGEQVYIVSRVEHGRVWLGYLVLSKSGMRQEIIGPVSCSNIHIA